MIRDSRDPRAVQRAWLELDAWLRRAFGERPGHDVVRQATLIAVRRGVAGLRAESAAQADAWVRRIFRRARTDEARARGVRERRLVAVADEAAIPAPVPDDDAPTDAERVRALEELDASVSEIVGAHLDATIPDPVKRVGDRARARVAMLRIVYRMEVAAIAAEVEAEWGEIGANRLYKWIERGREVLLAAIDGTPGAIEAPEIATLREILAARRKDAGQPRPERRRGGRQSETAPNVHGEREPKR